MENQIIKNEILLDLVYVAELKETEDEILNRVLLSYLRKLNCFMSAALKKNANQLETKHVLPIIYERDENWPTIIQYVGDNEAEIDSNKYVELKVNDLNFYIFSLANYGFIVLGRKKKFDLLFINDLKQVINFTGKILLLSIEDKIRQEYEIKIANERKLLRTIIDNLPISVYAKDLNYRKTLANKFEIEQCGFENEVDVLGKTDAEIYGKSIGLSTLREDKKVMTKDGLFLDQEKHLGNGEWALISKLPLKNEADETIGMVGMSVNFTDRKKNREQLEVFNLLFDNLSDAIHIAFENGQFFYINKIASDHLGLRQDEITQYKLWDIENEYIHKQNWTKYIKRVKQSNKITIESVRYDNKNNILIPVEVTVKYIVANEIGYVVISEHDISSLKAYEKELKYSNERLEQLALQSKTFAWEVDTDGIYTYVSPIVESVLGYTPEELISIRHFWDLMDNKTDILKNSVSIIGKKKPFNTFENKLTNKKGEQIWSSTTISPLYNSTGEFIGYRGSNSDISERKKNEEQLKENAIYQQSLLENLSVGIMIVDPKTKIIETINSFACKIFDFKAEDVIGQRCHSFICPREDGNCPVCDNHEILDNSDQVIINSRGEKIPVLKTVKEIFIQGELKLLESFVEISARKETEAKLRESEERKVSLISSMNDLVFVLDSEFRFVEYHQPQSFRRDNFNNYLGKKIDEIGLNQSAERIILEATRSCIETNKVTKAEYYIDENSVRKWYEINITILKLNDTTGLTCVVRDISENKNREKLIQQQIKLQSLLIKISSSYINVNIKDMYKVVNDSLKEMGEYVGADRTYVFDYNYADNSYEKSFEWCSANFETKTEELNSVAREIIPEWFPSDRKSELIFINNVDELSDLDSYKELLQSHGVKSMIIIPLIHNQDLMGFVGFDSLRKNNFLVDSEKQLIEIYAQMLLNLKIRKRSQAMIVSQEAKYRNIISNMNLGFVELDKENKISYVNKQFISMSGYSRNELMSRYVLEFLPESKTETLIKFKNDFMRNSDISALELEMVDKNNVEKWWLINGAAQYNDKDEMVGSISVFFDITSQKKLQYELEKSKQIAENAAKAKELFLTNMSHEIRTPLNVIIGMTRELGKEQLTSKQKEYISHSEASAYHLLSIVNNVLDMSKIEAGEFSLDKTDFSLSAVVSNVSSILSSRVKGKSIDFLVNTNPKIAKAFIGDPIRLTQVLINLLGNSVKFTDEGFVSLKVDINEINDKSQELRFEVSDSGIGMSEEFLQQIFSKFTQESSQSNRNYEGTGLGMSISKEIIELMGGKVQVESRKGIGTKIIFEIRFDLGTEAKLMKLDYSTKRIDISNTKVLLVEDNEMNRFIARQSLIQAKCIVVEAANGIEAIERVKAEDFDIILMDIQMPKMDGVEATKVLRQELHYELPIVALTANAFRHDIDLYLSIGMNDFLIKPYKEEDLYSIIFTNTHTTKAEIISIDSAEESKLENQADCALEQLYDLSQLEEIAGGDANFVKSMVEVFSKLAQETVSEMEQARTNADIDSLRKLAHKIKPSIDTMGINSILESIRTIESYPGQQIDAKLSKILDKVIGVLNKVIKELNK